MAGRGFPGDDPPSEVGGVRVRRAWHHGGRRSGARAGENNLDRRRVILVLSLAGFRNGNQSSPKPSEVGWLADDLGEVWSRPCERLSIERSAGDKQEVR